MPKSTLPPKPNLEKLRKQAKALLKAHKSGDIGVCETLKVIHRFNGLTQQEVLQSPVTLGDTQFAVALSYGFRDWEELRAHVEPMALIQQARKLISKGDNSGAREYLERAVELAPNNADIHADVAAIYRFLKTPQKALPVIMKARQLDPTQDRYVELLGKVYADLGRYEESYAAFGEAAESKGKAPGEATKDAYIPDTDRQRESFTRFLQIDTLPKDRRDTGLQRAFRSVFPIGNATREIALDFVSYRIGKVEHSVEDCARLGLTYEAPILVVTRLVFYDVNEASGAQSTPDIKEQEIHFGAIPLMTDRGTFIVNGREGAVLGNHNRSAGVFLSHGEGNAHSAGKMIRRSRIHPVRGSWLEMEVDDEGIVYAQIDRRQWFPVTTLFRALGYTAEDILNEFPGADGASNGSSIRKTLSLDKAKNRQEALVEIHELLRPEIPATTEIAQDFFNHLFFRPDYYDLSSVGRLRLNHCLGIDSPLNVRFLRKEDILLMVKALVEWSDRQVPVDDIEHLGAVGEMLEYLYRMALMRMARTSKESMGLRQVNALTLDDLVDPEPISAALREFFGGIENTKWYP